MDGGVMLEEFGTTFFKSQSTDQLRTGTPGALRQRRKSLRLLYQRRANEER